MYKRLLSIASLLCTCSAIPRELNQSPLVWQIFAALNRNVDYLIRDYSEINEDCLLGIVLATGFLGDVSSHDSLGENVTILTKKIDHLYEMSSNHLRQRSKSAWALELITHPKISRLNITFKGYNPYKENAFASDSSEIYNLFQSTHELEEYAKFSDGCLQNLAQVTQDLKPKFCKLDGACQKEFMESKYIRPGYLGTHKLLYLQLAKKRNCIQNNNIYEMKIRNICKYIFSELQNIDHYGYFGVAFDLALEQIVLCGSEGFSEFLSTKWLFWILQVQKSPGCFPSSSDSRLRLKRTVNEWANGCADHTTGLGTAVLSLYLDYLLKSEL